jgi:hypothetical protein
MNGTATFGTISNTAFSSPRADCFLAKYTNDLSTCLWALNFGGAGATANNIVAGLSIDQENNPIITGQLYGSNANINPLGTTTINFSSVGNNDCFVIKYNSNGQLWVNNTTITTIGINDQFQSKLLVFPNPTQDWIYFTEKYATYTKEIYDFMGKLIYKINDDKVDLSSCLSGIYVIKVLDKNNPIANYKIIKL